MGENLSGHHADRIQAAISSDAAAKSALVASWRRSSNLHRLDPAISRATLHRKLKRLQLPRIH